MMEIFTIRNVIIYIVVINIVGFFAMLIDKKKAKKQSYRISEKALLTIALIGGSIGSICGMYKFRHKTKKPAFYIGFPVILILQIISVIYFWA